MGSAYKDPAELVELRAKSERLRTLFFDLKSEKALDTERISKFVAESDEKSTSVTDLKAEKAASEVILAYMNSRADVLKHDLSHIRAEKKALQILTAALDGTVQEETDLLAAFDGKVRAMKTDLE